MPANTPAAEATTEATATRAPKTPRDPEGTALAAAAQELARGAGLTSRYSSGEARGVLDAFTVTKARGLLTVTRDGDQHRVKVATLKALLANERRDEDEVRDAAKLMTALSKGLPGTVYSRKLAAFLLARAA
jgi:hypothetical protein